MVKSLRYSRAIYLAFLPVLFAFFGKRAPVILCRGFPKSRDMLFAKRNFLADFAVSLCILRSAQ